MEFLLNETVHDLRVVKKNVKIIYDLRFKIHSRTEVKAKENDLMQHLITRSSF